MSGETTDPELAEAIRNYGYRRCKGCGRVWTQLDAKLNWLLCCGMPLEEAVIPVPLATYERLTRLSAAVAEDALMDVTMIASNAFTAASVYRAALRQRAEGGT